MGHQTAVPALPTVLASLVIDFLSNGMGVYEVGIVGSGEIKDAKTIMRLQYVKLNNIL